MKIKKIVLTAFLIFTAGLLFATEFTVKGDKYDITATYDDTSYPGEAFLSLIHISEPTRPY